MFCALERKSECEKKDKLSLIREVQLCKKDSSIFSPCRCFSADGFITWRKYNGKTNDKKIYSMG
jgi:hypothetical protein